MGFSAFAIGSTIRRNHGNAHAAPDLPCLIALVMAFFERYEFQIIENRVSGTYRMLHMIFPDSFLDVAKAPLQDRW